MSPSHRREVIEQVHRVLPVSERRTCQVLGQHRLSQRHWLSATDGALLARIVQDPNAATLHGLVQRFVALVREAGAKGTELSAHGIRRLEAFEVWIFAAKSSNIQAV